MIPNYNQALFQITYPAVSWLVHVPFHLSGIRDQVLHPSVLQSCWIRGWEYGLYSATETESATMNTCCASLIRVNSPGEIHTVYVRGDCAGPEWHAHATISWCLWQRWVLLWGGFPLSPQLTHLTAADCSWNKRMVRSYSFYFSVFNEFSKIKFLTREKILSISKVQLLWRLTC